MSEILQDNAVILIVMTLVVLCWFLSFPEKVFDIKEEPKRWKVVIYRCIAVLGTPWIFIETWTWEFWLFPSFFVVAGLLVFIWFVGTGLLKLIEWMLKLSDADKRKILKLLFL